MTDTATKKILGVYGHGGLGRGVYLIAEKIQAAGERWTEMIFIDDTDGAVDKYGRKILKYAEFKDIYSPLDSEIVIAVGEPADRAMLYDRVRGDGYSLATLIHPGVYIDKTVEIGEGVTVCEGVKLGCDIVIKANCHIEANAFIAHDVIIGRHCVIGTNGAIGGCTVIGDRVFTGMLSALKDHISVGDDVICSMAAAVFSDLPDAVIAVGNPARAVMGNKEKTVFGPKFRKKEKR